MVEILKIILLQAVVKSLKAINSENCNYLSICQAPNIRICVLSEGIFVVNAEFNMNMYTRHQDVKKITSSVYAW